MSRPKQHGPVADDDRARSSADCRADVLNHIASIGAVAVLIFDATVILAAIAAPGVEA